MKEYQKSTGTLGSISLSDKSPVCSEVASLLCQISANILQIGALRTVETA
jgi:hypothetical protein